eukprot:scaffold10828_cov143-Isochrysis_galbana.AAC.2
MRMSVQVRHHGLGRPLTLHRTPLALPPADLHASLQPPTLSPDARCCAGARTLLPVEPRALLLNKKAWRQGSPAKAYLELHTAHDRTFVFLYNRPMARPSGRALVPFVVKSHDLYTPGC